MPAGTYAISWREVWGEIIALVVRISCETGSSQRMVIVLNWRESSVTFHFRFATCAQRHGGDSSDGLMMRRSGSDRRWR